MLTRLACIISCVFAESFPYWDQIISHTTFFFRSLVLAPILKAFLPLLTSLPATSSHRVLAIAFFSTALQSTVAQRVPGLIQEWVAATPRIIWELGSESPESALFLLRGIAGESFL